VHLRHHCTHRTAYVIFTTLLAAVLPFFGAFTGLVGAVTYFPTAVAYPILMYMRWVWLAGR
jgi:hypothetical protein